MLIFQQHKLWSGENSVPSLALFFKPHFYWWSAIPPFLWWKIHVLSLLVPWPQSVVGHWESQKRLGTRTVSQSIPCSRCMTATPEYRMIQSCGLVWKSTNFIIFILFFEIPFTQTSTTTKLDDTTKELKELGTVSTTYNVADFSLQIYSVRIPRLLQK